MTRFARAKGSKASNARTPEPATSWQEMKQNITSNRTSENIESLEQDSKRAMIFQRPASNKNRINEERSTKWSEFPDVSQNETSKKAKKNKKLHSLLQSSKAEDMEDSNKAGGSKQKNKLNKSSNILDENFEKPEKIKKQESKKAKKSKKPQPSSQFTEGEDSQDVMTGSSKKEKKFHKSNIPESFEEPEEIQSLEHQVKKVKKNKKMQPLSQFTEAEETQEVSTAGSSKREKKLHKSNPKNKQQEYKRRKPGSQIDKMFINGNQVEIAYYDGFPIKKEDAERLVELKKTMISRGLPRSEIKIALKLERRKAEKSLAREKKKVCYNCRQSGHNLSECPQLTNESNTQEFGTGICFKCGSTEHPYFECKVERGDRFQFAQCFICKEQGHIARQCPDNSRGLYPKGGACKVCGDVTHLKKDCPKYQVEQQQQQIVLDTINDQHIESLDKSDVSKVNVKPGKAQKIIKF